MENTNDQDLEKLAELLRRKSPDKMYNIHMDRLDGSIVELEIVSNILDLPSAATDGVMKFKEGLKDFSKDLKILLEQGYKVLELPKIEQVNLKNSLSNNFIISCSLAKFKD